MTKKRGQMLLRDAQIRYDFHTTRALAWKAVIDLMEKEDEPLPSPTPRKPVAETKTRRKVDPQGVDKTFDFLKGRAGKTTTINQVASYFKISPMAAGYRLWALSNRKESGVSRVARGTYIYRG